MSATHDVRPRKVGRPRHSAPLRAGPSAREQILDAAAEMFAEQGYAAVSTRRIAEAVGVKQATLYYHFACKEDILAGLLAGTVTPSLDFAGRLSRTDAPPHAQVLALTWFDVRLLIDSPWNVGALYYLPEVRGERFAAFRREYESLRAEYGRRIAAGVTAGQFTVDSPEVATQLVFALAESVIGMRTDGVTLDPALPDLIGAACLRLLQCPAAEIEAATAVARDLLALQPG